MPAQYVSAAHKKDFCSLMRYLHRERSSNDSISPVLWQPHPDPPLHFPKEFAEFRLFKDAFQNTPECASLHKSVQVSAYGLAVRHIHKIGNNKNCTVRSRTNAVLDFFRITVCRTYRLLCPIYYILFGTKSNWSAPCPKGFPRKKPPDTLANWLKMCLGNE